MKRISRHFRSVIVAVVILGITWSCRTDNEIIPAKSIDEQLAELGLTRTKLGKQLENPYSMENMQLALDSLISVQKANNPNGRTASEEVELEVTDLYVRFLPRDSTQYDAMMVDTTMIYYDHPLDFEIEVQGDIYIDTTLIEGQLGWQYATVKPDHQLPDTIQYEILSELFIPENHPSYTEENGRISSELSTELARLEAVSLYLTGNLPEEEVKQIEQIDENGRRVCVWFVCWNVPDPWYPDGTIRIQDTELGWQPVEGVKVRARRWFTTKTTYTNSNGYFRTGSFKRDVNYSVVWERYQFSIREKWFWWWVKQATINGPKRKGSWNHNISSYTTDWFNGTVFQAAYHYYYQNISGLRRPPQNSFWKPQMKISARDKTNEDSNGNHAPWRRIAGIFSWVKVWRNNRDSDQIYATTIHELAHASHWNMGASDYNKANDKVAESWARGVEWVLTRMRYPNHIGRERSTGDYTLVVSDMIDDNITDNTNNGYGSIPGETHDQVNGYTIRQIEDALRGQRTWNGWRDNIENSYNNGTRNNLDALFQAWE